MIQLSLAKKGYGSYKHIKQMTLKDLFDMLEYDNIVNAIETHQIEESKKANNG